MFYYIPLKPIRSRLTLRKFPTELHPLPLLRIDENKSLHSKDDLNMKSSSRRTFKQHRTVSFELVKRCPLL